jgi:xanthine dehydrogenase large subunit
VKNIDAVNHTRGTSVYVDDIPVREGCLFGAVVASTIPRGEITKLDLTAARRAPGVAWVADAANIPGENQIGNILPDEPLFAENEVHFEGQPIALILAATEKQARAARNLVVIEYDEKRAVTDPREAAEQGDFIVPPRTFELGDPDAAWSACAHVFEGRADIGGQEHLYIETQGAYAYPTEGSGVHVTSSTQGPTAVQRATARVLGMPMHKIIVDVRRLGGAFGGKEDQATAWGVMAALGAHLTGRPVKLVLHRMDDMRMTGKRHPYSADFKIGLDSDLKICAYEVSFFQNAGAYCDLSPAVLERTLFHATNSYFIPNVRATARSCRTNLAPNTAFRGFGGPQGMFVMEAAIARAGEALHVAASEIQRRNLLAEGDTFPCGQKSAACRAQATWDKCSDHYDLPAMQGDVDAFNADNTLVKKGLAVMPVCFGISFTKTHMNQARALVHVYQDGSVGVSTGAVEMGQGVNTKLLQVTSHEFAIDPSRVKIETTNTTRIANTSPTAASASSDLNGKALQIACGTVRERLFEVARKTLGLASDCRVGLRDERITVDDVPSELTWDQVVLEAFLSRVNLSEHAHYATPGVHFDPETEKGEPFAYHVYGTAIVIGKVDCLRGRYEIEAVHVVHDFGKSMNESVDRGQAEGGIVQGLGWMTMEELCYDESGRLLSDALSTYKVPDIYSAPRTMNIESLATEGHPMALFGSKAVGEPPLMYGIGGYFALRSAVLAFTGSDALPFSAPITPEKALLALHVGSLPPN